MTAGAISGAAGVDDMDVRFEQVLGRRRREALEHDAGAEAGLPDADHRAVSGAMVVDVGQKQPSAPIPLPVEP